MTQWVPSATICCRSDKPQWIAFSGLPGCSQNDDNLILFIRPIKNSWIPNWHYMCSPSFPSPNRPWPRIEVEIKPALQRLINAVPCLAGHLLDTQRGKDSAPSLHWWLHSSIPRFQITKQYRGINAPKETTHWDDIALSYGRTGPNTYIPYQSQSHPAIMCSVEGISF